MITSFQETIMNLASVEFHSDARIICLCWIQPHITCRYPVRELIQDWCKMVTVSIKQLQRKVFIIIWQCLRLLVTLVNLFLCDDVTWKLMLLKLEFVVNQVMCVLTLIK